MKEIRVPDLIMESKRFLWEYLCQLANIDVADTVFKYDNTAEPFPFPVISEEEYAKLSDLMRAMSITLGTRIGYADIHNTSIGYIKELEDAISTMKNYIEHAEEEMNIWKVMSVLSADLYKYDLACQQAQAQGEELST